MPICVPTFKPPNKSSTRVFAFDFTKDIPGPGRYTPTQKATEMSKNMKGFNIRLYKNDRNIELHDKTKRDIPGPGTYRLPSDFGYFEPEPAAALNLTARSLLNTSSQLHRASPRGQQT